MLMDLIQIYQCFCDATRLRIINLLNHGPLCVCHFQDILKIPQTKVSQHLAYLRKHGLVETTRVANWIIYSLPAKPSPELKSNLKCLQDCVQTDGRFKGDIRRRGSVRAEWVDAAKKKACSCV
jgi:DNA-binding transcriptional ArsR family regulator